MARYPTYIGVKVGPDLAKALKRAAREDERCVSAYVRRLIRDKLAPQTDAPAEPSPTDGDTPA
ncbi:MAG: hypothetical protein IT179_13520 [Acidobacteria bacterium]|nr:hypothetical protein [Acidobacteriota bacterium]